MCDKKGPPYKRTGPNSRLTIDEAKDRFDEYYEENTTTNVGKFRAKLFDMMFQKKDKKTIKCDTSSGLCEEGSVKYCNAKGPKTFDVEGVDYFDEGTKIHLEKPDGTMGEWLAKGHTNVRQIDKDTKLVISGKIGSKNKKIYAQRDRKTDELISQKSKRQHAARKGPGGDLHDIDLVDLYHQDRKKNPEKYKTLTKKRVFNIKFNMGAIDYEQYIFLLEAINTEGSSPKHISKRMYSLEKKTLDIYHKTKIVPKDSDEYDVLIKYLETLELIEYKGRTYVWKGDDIKFVKVEFWDGNNGERDNFILEIETGHTYDSKPPHNPRKIGKRNKTIMDIWKQAGEPDDDEHSFEIKGKTQMGGSEELLSDYSCCSDEENDLTDFWFNE